MKKLLAIILVLVTAISFAACGNDKSVTTNQDNSSSVTEEESSSVEETSKEDSSIEESKSEEPNLITETTTPTAGISEKWEDLEFAIDGKKFKIPFSYKEYQATGWSFDLADIGYANGYILNPKDKTYATIDLKNSKYNPDMRMNVGFINNDTKAKDILECSIWALIIDINSGFKRLDNVPKVEIAKGITWSSSKADVEKAFGKPKDVYENKEYGYVVYMYDLNYSIKLKLDIYDNGGVSKIELNKY